MPRPCTCEACHLCRLYQGDERYRRLWDAPPGLLQKAANFAGAVVRHVAGGMRQADDAVVEARLKACESCPQGRLSADRRCLECGCPVDAKARWASERCPLGAWDAHAKTSSACDCGGA